MKCCNVDPSGKQISRNRFALPQSWLKLGLRMVSLGLIALAVSLIPHAEQAVARTDRVASAVLSDLDSTLSAAPISQSGAVYQLAYSKWDGSAHNLYVADTNGQNERLIFSHAAGPSWSPDSKRLFFYGEPGIDQQIRENRVACSFGTISDGIVSVDLPSPLGDICQVQPGAWTCERKTVDLAAEPSDVCTANGISVYQNLDWKEGTARWAGTSPDGEAVAFDAKPGGDTYRIYFRAMLGTSQQFRYELLGEQGSWSPDGQRMVYRSGRDNKAGLWISNRDDSGHTLLTNDGSDSFPAWSPDGRTITFSRQVDGNVDIYTIAVDGSNLRRLTDAPGHDTLPTYTPSGDIIFRSDRTGSWGIWKMGGSGAGQVEIIPNAGVGPDWAFSRVAVDPKALYAPPPPATVTPIPVVLTETPATIPGAAATGEKIAFVSDRDGNDEIYVMNVDGSGLIRLTNHPDDDRYPAWSPDGQWLAFSREGVYVMRPDGAGQKRLTDFGGCPAWSPDGRHIAFSHSSQLYVMNSDGSGLAHLGYNINCPTWLPDGRHIAYFLGSTWVVRIDMDGQSHLVDGSGPTCTALHPDHNYIRCEANFRDANSAAWSANSQQIAFESFSLDERDYEIYKMGPDGNLSRLTHQPGPDTTPTWSADDQRIAFTSGRDGNREIYMMNADGSGVTRLTEHPANDWHPAWSPVAVEIKAPVGGAVVTPTVTPVVAAAGQGKIVFTCTMYDYKMNDDGTFVTHPADGSKVFEPKMEICIINEDGSGLTRLSYHSHRNYARDPAWSPDRQQIAFSDDNDIYVMSADGSGLTRLTNSPDRLDTSPTWSPDGQKIAFCSDVTSGVSKPGVFVMNSDGSGLTHLIDHQCFNPEWSPDGSKIALDGIDVINPDGSNLVQLTSPGNSPNWSADGQKILFTRGGSLTSDFFVINADGTGVMLLATHQATEYWPNWSPDGQRIVFHSDRHGTGSTFDLYVMNTDGSEVTRLTEKQELNGGATKLVDASYPDW